MIRTYITMDGLLVPVEGLPDDLDSVVWIDTINPTSEEEALLERILSIDIPTVEEMEEIESSSRIYVQDDATVMTAILPADADGDDPRMRPVSFVLAADRLLTVRHHEPRPFKTFPVRASKMKLGCHSGEVVLMALLEAVVDRLADILERAGGEIDAISRDVFRKRDNKPTAAPEFRAVLENIGRKGDLTSKMRDSLVTLERLAGFLGQETPPRRSAEEIRERVKTLYRDIRSLSDHAGFLSQKINFLLDATLGMISIEQNAIIKIFSVAAVVFLPPTLVASIYGMNFHNMPELSWSFGYPFAIVVMIISAILPFLYFKRRGWL